MNNTTAVASGAKEVSVPQVYTPTLLGPKFNFPRAGTIRPGVMVPKKSCSEADVELYRSLVKNGVSWEEIEKELGFDARGKSKLVPKNVDFFTIHPEDCSNPENVKRIYDLYADDDGRLRSFPVVFPVNEWWNVIPHALRCFGSNGLKYKSEFRLTEDTNGDVTDAERVCRFPLELKPGKKVFGGRKWGERPCEPDACLEYQKGECVFGGLIQFLIPGVPGMGVWTLPTTSWYSLDGVKDSLNLFSRITGGRISGTFGKPEGVFRIRKKRGKISRIDPMKGKAVKTEQWLITLDADIDLTELASACESKEVLGTSRRAVALLSGKVKADAFNGNDAIKDDEGDHLENPDACPENDSDSASIEVPENTCATNGSGEEPANGKKSGKKELTPSAKLLWQSVSKMHKDNSERKTVLKGLTGVDSFYDLTEEQARKGLEVLAGRMLNRY